MALSHVLLPPQPVKLLHAPAAQADWEGPVHMHVFLPHSGSLLTLKQAGESAHTAALPQLTPHGVSHKEAHGAGGIVQRAAVPRRTLGEKGKARASSSAWFRVIEEP